ncbi:glutaminyl-peptide cyclotransferase [Sphingomonas sp. KR3-1]|uniref:glutaminyl-peptide cyclotransferase n=1 Tax=Sphingomonas sp. KR3-1 TaxID=3156611 RepID=UPI0032B4FB10
MKRILLAVVALAVIAAGVWFFLLRSSGIPVYAVTVAATHPHDPTAFTEGLFFKDGALYESTGEAGTSYIRKVDPATGKVLQQVDLPAPYFGEGIVPFGDKLYQVTWQDKTGFTYNFKDFALGDTFSYTGEGWGMTQNGKNIILSDGTPELRFLDPKTMQTVSTLKVTANGCPVEKLNELEWIDGEIWANIWQTNLIARIDPASGQVKSFLDVSGIAPKTDDPDIVPNGIAYDEAGKRTFVVGKRWPQLFEIKQGAAVNDNADAAKLTACSK